MKFKNIKKKTKKSPSNSRSIPDFAAPPLKLRRVRGKALSGKPAHFKFSLPKISHVTLLKIYRRALKVFVVFIFIVAVIIVGFDFKNNLQTKQNIDIQREVLIKDLNFWESFLAKNQNYRDAYFQASILEYRLGNTSKAKMYAEKGLSLDPNSVDGQKLEKFLVGK